MKKNLIVKKTLMTTVSQISSGPNKGFYKLTTAAERTDTTGSQLYLDYVAYQNSVAGDSIVHYKYSPGPGKKITGFSKTMLPYVDGYYYISKSYPQVRKLLYALENRLLPSSGNTEQFNVKFDSIHVPDTWRPYYLDPCVEPWCAPPQKKENAKCVQESAFQIAGRWLWLTMLCMVLAGIVLLLFFALKK